MQCHVKYLNDHVFIHTTSPARLCYNFILAIISPTSEAYHYLWFLWTSLLTVEVRVFLFLTETFTRFSHLCLFLFLRLVLEKVSVINNNPVCNTGAHCNKLCFLNLATKTTKSKRRWVPAIKLKYYKSNEILKRKKSELFSLFVCFVLFIILKLILELIFIHKLIGK